ncbi:patatin-like phospholipase family protein [Roseateles sp.]|uniref:patatin-like phospholipase family protein n=1 Tax=Roseateles sp. TaxID=1971397 RepID=UPI00286C1455|nr:patatin-like phospholipase family protein [Roseateles sp.]
MNLRPAALYGLLATLSLSGCTAYNYTAPDSPVPLTTASSTEPKPRVALVLGSGGPRGYAHIGVLKVLEEAGVQVDLLVGSSVGSLLGAFWAAGYNAAQLDEAARSGGPLTLFDPSLFADRGWIHGQRLQDYVNLRLGNASLEQLPRRLIVATTRRDDKQPVFFERGNVGVAVRASSAVAGVISPVGVRGVEYEDAEESLPVAVRAARQAGATFVIAVDVSARAGKAAPGTTSAQRDRDARRRSRIDLETRLADFVIHPDMAYAAGPRASYFSQAQRAGEAEAQHLLPDLLRKMTLAGVR